MPQYQTHTELAMYLKL